jgi:hypothetical protein
MPHYPSRQAVIETPDYLSDADATGISRDERATIVDFIAANPRAGDLIPGSGGARKLRFAGRGKGKSGGYRVITYFGGEDIPVFLLAIFAKGDRVNLSKAETNELRRELSGLAEDYRKGAKQHVKSR